MILKKYKKKLRAPVSAQTVLFAASKSNQKQPSLYKIAVTLYCGIQQ